MSTLAHMSIEEFNRLAESGAFEDQRVELIDGELRDMSPIGPKHEEGSIDSPNGALPVCHSTKFASACKAQSASTG